MIAHYEGWGEHHAYRCGKDDGFTDGHFAAVQACIAAVEATIQHDDACKSVIPGRECNCTRFDALAALREIQP